MKLGVLSFVAAMLAAPLAAQASDTQTFAVTLRGSIVDRFSYEYSESDGDCTITRSGTDGRSLVVRSIRPARIRVARAAGGVAYRPSRLNVRLTGTSLRGSATEIRRCRAAPLERVQRDCAPKTLPRRGARARFFRPSANRLAFRTATGPSLDLCGVEGHAVHSSWLDLAEGALDEQSLFTGRVRRVVVRGAVTRESHDADLNLTTGTMVRWTLTFRRLSG
jgi:hypothetical protein